MNPAEIQMLQAAASRANQQIRPVRRIVVRAGAVLMFTALTAGSIWYFSRRAQVEKWMRRMDEQDVMVAGYFVTIVGPKKLIDRIKKLIVDKVKSIPAIGIMVKGWEWVTGGTGIYKACEAGVDLANDWALVQEAYDGLTGGRELHADMQKKLTIDEFQKIMTRVRKKKERIETTTENNADTRRKFIALIEGKMEKIENGGVWFLPWGSTTYDFEAFKLYAYEDIVGYKTAEADGLRYKAKKGALLGTWTRFVKKIDNAHILMQLSTDKGKYWFPLQKLSHKI